MRAEIPLSRPDSPTRPREGWGSPISAWRTFALLLVASLGWACGEGSAARRCDPTRGTGCGAGEACALDREGAPRCVSPGGRGEGERCAGEAECVAGTGCVRVGGLSRCLRFCRPAVGAADSGEEPCQDEALNLVEAPFRHDLSGLSRCLVSPPDRPDVGLCVLPCLPDQESDECPACALLPGAPMAVCAEPGPQLDGDACGPSIGCGVGLYCVSEGEGHYCRVAADELGICAFGGVPRPVSSVNDPVTGRDLLVCVMCVHLNLRPWPALRGGPPRLVCPPLVNAADAFDLCRENRAVPAALDGEGPLALATALAAAARVEIADGALWVPARRLGEDWRWVPSPPLIDAPGNGTPGRADGGAGDAGVSVDAATNDRSDAALPTPNPVDLPRVDPSLWAPDEPSDAGDCALLDPISARLSAAPCAARAHPLCTEQSGALEN